jgi:phenylalanine-4-hydroxylase
MAESGRDMGKDYHNLTHQFITAMWFWFTAASGLMNKQQMNGG